MNPTLNSILTHQLGLTRFLTVRCVSFREVTSCSTPQRDKRTDRRSREDDLPGISVLPAADGSFLAVHRDWHGQPGQLARDTHRSRARPPRAWRAIRAGGFWSCRLLLLRLFQRDAICCGLVDCHLSLEVTGAADAAGRCGPVRRSQTEQSLKGGHRLSPAIVTKNELIQVDGKLNAADAVVGADQPLLEVADGPVGQRDDRRDTAAQIPAQGLGPSDVSKPRRVQPGERLQPVGIAWSTPVPRAG